MWGWGGGGVGGVFWPPLDVSKLCSEGGGGGYQVNWCQIWSFLNWRSPKWSFPPDVTSKWGGGFQGIPPEMGGGGKIWTKIYCSARNLCASQQSLTYYVCGDTIPVGYTCTWPEGGIQYPMMHVLDATYPGWGIPPPRWGVRYITWPEAGIPMPWCMCWCHLPPLYYHPATIVLGGKYPNF